MTKDDATSSTSVSPTWHMTQVIWGAMRVQAISVVAALGIADLVAERPRTPGELAAMTNTHGATLRRLLRAVATLAIFAEDTEGRFVNTPLSETLRTNLFHESFFDRLGHEVEDASVFNAAMGAFSELELSAVLAAYDFSRFSRLVDVGGGRGALLNGILTATPDLHGVLYDLPAVVGDGVGLAVSAGPKCEIVAGSFFETVPVGADVYVLKRIIHDWNDADAHTILANCRRAIRQDGTLILIEWVLRPPNEPDLGKFMDLHMLVTLGGRERTESEFRALLAEAGFVLTRVIPTGGPHSIVEARPA